MCSFMIGNVPLGYSVLCVYPAGQFRKSGDAREEYQPGVKITDKRPATGH